jgi:N-methylhydantoinase B
MMGGYPGSVNVYKFKRNTDIKSRLGEQRIPTDIAEVRGEEITLQLRQENFIQHPSDVYAVIWSAAGGFGDPFERDPERVRADVAENRAVSRAAAREIYGVVLSEDGALDAKATRALRAERRATRRRADDAVKRLQGKEVARISDNLTLRSESDALHTCCAKCGADLGSIRANYKDACVVEEHEIGASNPNIGDWRRYIDDRPLFRQFFCPGCGALIENEIARESDPVLRDIELHLK